jgi:hypothetical protein
VTIYEVIQYIYRFLVGGMCILFIINIVNKRKIGAQLIGAFVLLPFLLRFLLIK